MRIVKLCFCLFCAVLFCQLPAFSKQYAIRLESHLSELEKVLETFSLSLVHDKTVKGEELVRHAQKESRALAEYAEFLQRRYARFHEALDKMASSNPILYPFWMVWGFDKELLVETWNGFTPSLFFNMASFAWALFGAIFAEAILLFFQRLFSRLRRPTSP